jgi:secreted trypsin-like serine protease
MKIARRGDILQLSVIILFSLIRLSHQTVYSCDPNASCGCSTNPVSINRIVGGENAGKATWGWAVSISIDGNGLCGGSIISSSWVITAAHCVVGYTASQFKVYAGSNRRHSGTQIRVASKVIVHPNYDPDTNVNDIALLQLDSALKMSDPYVSTICIPSVSSAILSVGEWPPVNTAVSNSFASFSFCSIYYQYCSIGCCCWMG